MSDDKNKDKAKAKAAGKPSPFADDVDWDSELEAWDAALPIPGAPADEAAARPTPNGEGPGAAEPAPELPAAAAAAAPAPAPEPEPEPEPEPAISPRAAPPAPVLEAAPPPPSPPSEDTIQFSPEEIADSSELVLHPEPAHPRFTGADEHEPTDADLQQPAAAPPRSVAAAPSVELDLTESDVLEEITTSGERPVPAEPVAPAAAGATPAAPGPTRESSGLFLIPGLDELAALSTAPAPTTPEKPRKPPSPSPAPSRKTTLKSAPPPAPRPERTLTSDGLPELSGLFSVETILKTAQPAPAPEVPDAGASIYEADPPPEEPVELNLSFSVEPAGWDPESIASLAVLTDRNTPPTPATARRYWREQLAFWTDELAAAKDDGGIAPEAVARRAVAAARAAEHAGNHDIARRLHVEALEAKPAWSGALRGRLRLREGSVEPGAARELFAILAEHLPSEKAATQTLFAEWDDPDGGGSALAARGAGAGSSAGALAGDGAARHLSDAERALRTPGARAETAAALAEAGRALGGTVGASLLVEASRLRELDGDFDGAARTRREAGQQSGGEQGVAFAALRRAVRAAPAEALAEVDEAAATLTPSPLHGAVLRWAARLARAAGRPEEARARLARATRVAVVTDLTATTDRHSLAWLPERDRLEMAAATGATESGALSAHGEILAAVRRAGDLAASGNRSEALVLLRAALTAEPEITPAALAAEELARRTDDLGLRAEALAVWAAGDPARRSMAARLRAEVLAAAGDKRGALEALTEAAAPAPPPDAQPEHPPALDPADPTLWELAWARLRAGDRAAAATALDGVARGWYGQPGAGNLVAALDERIAELRRAADPTESIGDASLLGGAAGTDDPTSLVAKMLDPRVDPAGIAALLKSEAAPGLTHRALEAAGWMVQAGSGAEALDWLAARLEPGQPVPRAVAVVLRRLARVHASPEVAARVLALLAAGTADETARLALELQSAEALEAAGDAPGAAAAYRRLASGPLAEHAGPALRRVLWSLRDGPALVAQFRDEADAHRVAGRPAGAAAALVERSRAHAELMGDAAAAHQSMLAARDEDDDNAEARMAVLADSARRNRTGAVLALLEETAVRDMPSIAPAMLYLAALLDEGRAGGEEANRFTRTALLTSGGDEPGTLPPLALRLRVLAEELGRDPDGPAAAEATEVLARNLQNLAGGDDRTVATMLVRAAEARQRLQDGQQAEALLRQALAREPKWLPALLRLKRRLLAGGQWEGAVAVCETEAVASASTEHQARALMLAAAVAESKLGDRGRAAALLRRVLEVAPGHRPAFNRLRQVLERAGDHAGIADLLAHRVRAMASDAHESAALRLERATLLAGALGDRLGAKEELRVLVHEHPQNTDALSRLATLELEDGAYAVAAELYIRQARFDRNADRLLETFLRIGRIYLRRLPDFKMATGAFERVLRLDPDNREALEALSELYTKQNETRRALAVTEPLVEREADPQKRLPFLLRTASLWERAGDIRRAAMVLKRAAEECPRSLQAVGELARFYERAREPVARNVLLDGSIGLLREDLARDPRDLGALRSIIPLLRWRQRHACSAAAAQMLALLSDDVTEKREAAAWAAPPANGRHLTPLANPETDELALPPTLPRGIRHVLRLLGPTLERSVKPNLKRWAVGRAQRQTSGTGVRPLADAIAGDLGVRDFDLYLSSAFPQALVVEPGDPPAVILGEQIAQLGPAALRFAFGYAIRLVATHLNLLANAGPSDAAILMAAVVRQFIPDFHNPTLADADVEAVGSRVSRAMSKGLRNELAPFASEIAAPIPPEHLFLAVHDTAARVGLLASGDLAASLTTLCAAHGRPPSGEGLAAIPVAAALIDFALSEEHEELVQALDAVSAS